MTQASIDQIADSVATRPTLVSFPTDTVPALAAHPQQAGLIYAAKRRPPEKPLILMGASLNDLLPYVAGDGAAVSSWMNLAERYWPGPLTLVLTASKRAPKNLNPLSQLDDQDFTLGIRVPNHPLALALLAKTGPMATTSANLSGQPPLMSPTEITQTFPDALILSDELYKSVTPVTSGTPSTVVKWTGFGWQVLRQGEVII